MSGEEDTDANDLFKKIQESMKLAEGYDTGEDDDDNETDQINLRDLLDSYHVDGKANAQPALQQASTASTSQVSEKEKPGAVKKLEPSKEAETPVQPQHLEAPTPAEPLKPQSQPASPGQAPQKKVYQFTEVSSGQKRDARRFSQSLKFGKMQKIATHSPLLKTQDISQYLPQSARFDEILKGLKKRNEEIVDKVSKSQKAIYKKMLLCNMLSEEIMKKSDEHLQLSTSRTSEEKMREFELVEVSLFKTKVHLNYLTQRMEIIEECCDAAFKDLAKRYEEKLTMSKK